MGKTMKVLSVRDLDGFKINEGTINERIIKLVAGKGCDFESDAFASGISEILPGFVHEEHAHEASDELIFVLGGAAKLFIDDHPHDVCAGNIIVLRRGERHRLMNESSEPLRLLWIYSPPDAANRFIKK